MKVLFAAHQATEGGAQNILHTVMVRLAGNGIEPMAVFPEDGPAVEKAREAGLSVRILPTKCWMFLNPKSGVSNSFTKYLSDFGDRVSGFEDLIRREAVDVVYTNTSVIIEPAIAAYLSGCPHVWHVHELFSCDEFIQASGVSGIVAALMRDIGGRIVAVSEAVRNDPVLTSAGIEARVVHNGIGGDRISKRLRSAAMKKELYNCDPETRIVLFVGDLVRTKGMETLFEAAGTVLKQSDGTMFFLAGREYEYDFEELLESVPPEKRGSLRYLGFRQDVPELLGNADVLIVPSRGDAFPTVVLEAMAAGIPVVGTRSGGMEEQIVDGETGYLVSVDSPAELASAISKIVEDPNRAAAMGTAGQRRVHEHFREETMVGSIRAVIEEAHRSRPVAEDACKEYLLGMMHVFESRERENRRLIEENKRLRGIEDDHRAVLNMLPFRLYRGVRDALLRIVGQKPN